MRAHIDYCGLFSARHKHGGGGVEFCLGISEMRGVRCKDSFIVERVKDSHSLLVMVLKRVYCTPHLADDDGAGFRTYLQKQILMDIQI